MASFQGNMDLMAFSGAKYLSEQTEDGKQIVYAAIPLTLNEVKCTVDNNGKHHARVRLTMWPTSDALFNAVNQRRIQSGNDPLTREQFQSHNIEISHTVDYVKLAIKHWGRKLIDKVLERNPKHPEYNALEASDENSPTFKAIRSFLQPTLASMYVYRGDGFSRQAQPAGAPVAQGVSGYTTTDDADPFTMAPDGDLPF